VSRRLPPTPDIERLRAVLRDAPAASSEAAQRTMRGNRRRDSEPELRLRRALHAVGLRFRVDLPIRVPDRRPIRPDVVFTKQRVAVFVDGCFWHGCAEHGRRPRTNSTYWDAKVAVNQARDREQTSALTRAGWAVVRVWEHEALETALPRVLEALAAQAAIASGASTSAARTPIATP
jgi:DNA mismatch endonuclease (patch repair protein)